MVYLHCEQVTAWDREVQRLEAGILREMVAKVHHAYDGFPLAGSAQAQGARITEARHNTAVCIRSHPGHGLAQNLCGRLQTCYHLRPCAVGNHMCGHHQIHLSSIPYSAHVT